MSHISLSLYSTNIYIYTHTYISFAPPTNKDPENHNFTEECRLSTLPFGNTTRSTQLRKVMARAQEMKPHIWDHSPLMRLAAWMALDSSTPFWRISLLGITVMLCSGHRPKSHIILHDIVPVIKSPKDLQTHQMSQPWHVLPGSLSRWSWPSPNTWRSAWTDPTAVYHLRSRAARVEWSH